MLVLAISATDAMKVRGQLQGAYNSWLEKVGIGKAETEYRSAYKLESNAELRDHINHSLTYIEKGGLDRLTPLLKNGTYTKGDVLQGIRTYLGNSDPEQIVKKFSKLDSALVGNRLLTKEEMLPFEQEAKRIQ